MILVMLAGLAGFMVSLSTTQQIGSALDVQGSKAYSAAQSGTEWGLYRAITAGACAGSTDIGAIDGMNVTVTCTSSAVPEQGSGASFYSITATACNLPSGTTCPGATANPLYVERRVSALSEH